MITTDYKDARVSVAVFGEFTLSDFREFEDLVLTRVDFSTPVVLLFDLSRMAGFTVDMAWEEIKFSRQHGGDFARIAVITDSQWVTWSAWLEQLFLGADVRVFSDPAEATGWLAE